MFVNCRINGMMDGIKRKYVNEESGEWQRIRIRGRSSGSWTLNSETALLVPVEGKLSRNAGSTRQTNIYQK
jgi:hypothetical protein